MVGYQEVTLKPGQFIFGRRKAASELNLSERVIRTCLKALKNFKQLTIETTNKFSILSIVNWDIYQSNGLINDQQDDQQTVQSVTNKRPASDQQVTTNKNDKECKNGKNETPFVDGVDFLITKRKRKLNGKRWETFKLFWDAFGYKKGKREAADSWYDIPSLTDKLVNKIIKSAKLEAQKRPQLISKGKTPKMAQGWISGFRWEDEQQDERDASESWIDG